MKAPWIYRFTLWFFIAFLAISLLGYILFHFIDISFITFLCYFAFSLFFLLGIIIGRTFKPHKFFLLTISSENIINIIFPISVIAILLGWMHMIRYYGSITYIIANSFTIRSETIGDGIQIIPTYISYLSSLAVAGFPLSMSRYFHRKQTKDIFFLIFFAILIVLMDLQSFGRVGILYIIFVTIACLLLYKIKVSLPKLTFSGIIALVVLMLPRWIRGGKTLEGVAGTYDSFLRFDLPSFCDPFISLYAYYFSGIFAFNELLEQNITLSWGERNFSSLINLYHRFFGSAEEFHRITIIAQPAYVPYKHNIYTLLGETYMDFGFLGLLILPLFFGSCIGFLFKYKGIYADALKLVLIAWIFYIPIYNLFSFGGFMLAFMFLTFFTIATNNTES